MSTWISKNGEWHPAKVLTWLIEHPAADLSLKYMCAKELLGYIAAPKAAQLRIDANGPGGDTHITIVVPSWAANGNGDLIGNRRVERADVTVERPAIDVSPSHTRPADE